VNYKQYEEAQDNICEIIQTLLDAKVPFPVTMNLLNQTVKSEDKLRELASRKGSGIVQGFEIWASTKEGIQYWMNWYNILAAKERGI